MQKTKTTSYTQLLLLVMCSIFFIYALAQRSNFEHRPEEPEIQVPQLVAKDVTGYTFSGNTITEYDGNAEILDIPMCYSIGHSNSFKQGVVTFYGYEEVPTFIQGTDYVVSIISDSVFSSKSQIRKVILPDTLEYVGNFAFQFCSNLEEVEFNDGLISIGDSSFWGTGIRTLSNLPDTLEEIKPYAFLRCRNLVDVVIPHNIRELILGVFHDCTSLREVKIKSYYEIRIFLSNPYKTFSNCPNLERIYIREELLDYYLNSDWNIYSEYFVPTHFEGD